MTEAERIVQALAAFNAPNLDGTYANGHDWCMFCTADNAVEPEQHDADCPWRMAREYVAKQVV